MFPLKRRHIKKPDRSAGIDRSHPLTKNLWGCWMVDERSSQSLLNLADNNRNTVAGNMTLTPEVGIKGRKVSVTASVNQSGVTLDSSLYDAELDSTLFSIYALGTTTGTGTERGIFGGNAAGGTGRWNFIINTSDKLRVEAHAGGYNNVVSTTTIAQNTLYGFGGTYDKSNLNVYINGIKEASTAETDNITALSENGGLLAHQAENAGADFSWEGDIYVVLIWNRALSDYEMKAVHDNPWQILQPYTQYIDTTVAAAGGATGKSNPLMGPLGGPLYGAIC